LTSSVARHRTAFTLIEALAVITIIGVLAALLLPVISSARQSANAAQCASNLSSLGRALMLYSSENNGQIPAWETDLVEGGPGVNPEKFFFWLLLPYLANVEPDAAINNVPALVRAGHDTYTKLNAPGVPKEFGYRVYANQPTEFTVQFAVNKALDMSNVRSTNGNGLGRPTRMLDIEKPSQTPYLITGFANFTTAAGQDPNFTLPADPSTQNAPPHRIFFPYKGTAKVLYLDGHVESQEAPIDPDTLNPWD
jgi:prepilin-type N-terminal cleavage/methylation domain-containing protein/prepilin-type processing-associated H-X9-DG protein